MTGARRAQALKNKQRNSIIHRTHKEELEEE